MMAFFQNCGQTTKFSGHADVSAKSTEILAPVESNDVEEDGDTTEEITQPEIEGEDDKKEPGGNKHVRNISDADMKKRCG